MMIRKRSGYTIFQKEGEPGVCVRETKSDEGKERLRWQQEGWQAIHEAMGRFAVSWSRLVHPERLEKEFIPGVPLVWAYGFQKSQITLPSPDEWGEFWEQLRVLWSADPQGVSETRMSENDLWHTWFSISDLRKAKHCILTFAWLNPLWSVEALSLKMKFGRGYTEPPEVARRILESSERGLILGDLHFENLLVSDGRLVFIDYETVARGPIAFDLAWMWMEWWLAQGLLHGDDGFLPGFRRNWRDFVGPEAMLCEMTREWAKRVFSWLLFAHARYPRNLSIRQSQAHGMLAPSLRSMAEGGRFDSRNLDSFLNVPALVSGQGT